MSRSTIGGVVGAVIGFVVSGYNPAGAQLGWVIGSGIGALTDNTKTYGPRAGDASQQTSQDGTICTYGYGEFATTGVILWRDERKEKENEQGKGGPKNVTYSYTWTYAIGVCKGPIGGYLIIKRNGTVVFDARSNAELTAIGYTASQIEETRAAQTKFLKYAKFYLGTDDQMPDPSIQAVKGVNNVPAYRGRAYIVMTDDPVTDDGAAIPNYEFVVASCGEGEAHVADGSGILITGGGTTPFITAAPTAVPEFVAIPTSTGADEQAAACSVNEDGLFIAVSANKILYSTSITTLWNSVDTPYAEYAGRFGVHGPDGWLLQYSATGHAGPIARASSTPTDADLITINIAGGATRDSLSMIARTGGLYYGCVGFESTQVLLACPSITGEWVVLTTTATSIPDGSGHGIRFFHDIVEFEDNLYASVFVAGGGGYIDSVGQQVRRSLDGGATWPDLIVDGGADATTPLQLCVGDTALLVVNSNVESVYTSADGFSELHTTGISRNSEPLPRNEKEGRFVARSSGRFYIMGDTGVVSTTNGTSFSAIAPYPATFNVPISIAAHDAGVVGRPIPDAPGHYVDPISGGITGGANSAGGLQPCEITLDEVVLDQCAIRSVTRVDATQLEDDIVRGFRVATQTSPKDNIRSLQGSYFFDASDYDGYLHFVKRPQPDTFLITTDDLVETGDKPIQWEITKENDLLRKVSVSYFDPQTNYTITSQDFERAIVTIKAQGEGVFDSALTASKDFTKQMAEKSVLVAWAERYMATVKVRLNHAARVTGEWGKLQDKDGQLHTVRITHIKNEGVTRQLTLRKTRRSAYSSRAIGLASPNPTFPGSGIRGPNVSVIMNMPGLRLEDDKAGIYWASAGMMRSWRGAVLELSRSGGAWELGPTISAPCTMGELTEPLPFAPRYGRDELNTLTVQLFAYAPKTLASGTDEDLLAEKNAAALVYPDGKVEIIQFKTATLVGERLYELTGLYRGCKDTTPGEHLAGAIFVLLDDAIRFVAIRPDDVGKTLSFRSTSLGTDPDFADVDTLTFGSIESLREWQPYHVVVESNGAGGFCVSWIGRARFGTSRAPIHSQWFAGYRVRFTANGVFYEVDTTDQEKCVDYATLSAALGTVFGWPDVTVRAISRIATNDDDFDSPTSPPPVTPTPVAITSSGAPASPVVGPNGGFKDDIPYPVPEPTVFGSNVVDGGGFNVPGDLSKWRDSNGNPLDGRWSLVGNRLCFFGTGTASAFNWAARKTLSQQILPHYAFDVTGEIQSDAGAKGSIGVGMGFSTAGGGLTTLFDIDADADGTLEHPMSALAEYGTATAVAHYFEDKRMGYNATAAGQTVITIVAPAVAVAIEGEPKRVYFDIIEMEITENAPATTPQTIANLDFSAGLTDWVEFPPSSPLSPSPVVSAGRAIFTPVSEYGTHKYIININAIPDLDTLDKWLELIGKTWCDDPTVYSGMTQSGVGLQFAISLDGGTTFNYTAWANAVERGDWTQRKRWIRQTFMTAGLTFHVCVLFKCKVGYSAGVKDLAANVTNAPVT